MLRNNAAKRRNFRRFCFYLILIFAAPLCPSAQAAAKLIEPVLKLQPAEQNIGEQAKSAPVIALTFDLCMGQTDRRIFTELVQQNIPATLFVTKRWLVNKANASVIEEIKARPDLFEIANHGASHIPPIDSQPTVYGLKTAGSLSAVCMEAAGGAAAIKQAGLWPAQMSDKYWYRGAAALYSPAALRLLRRAGYSIAGFSVNGDEGAGLSAEKSYERIVAAKNGDVVIAHMNQPGRAAGAGVAKAIAELRRRNYRFVRLSAAETTETAHYAGGKAAPNCPAALEDMMKAAGAAAP